MNIQKLTKKFWKDGYYVIENFFAPEMMDSFNRHYSSAELQGLIF